MKKFLLFLAASFLLAACNSAPKVAVVYFSATGNTRAAAVQLAGVMQADVIEIVPEALYTPEDLDWRDRQSRNVYEEEHPDFRPALAASLPSIKDYDVVFVGYPIWAGVAPRVVLSYLDSQKLEGKTLIPFATSGMTPIDKSQEELERTYPEAVWKQGMRLNDVADSTLMRWRSDLELN